MAVGKRAKAVCDICGFVYPHNVMKKNSFGLLVCVAPIFKPKIPGKRTMPRENIATMSGGIHSRTNEIPAKTRTANTRYICQYSEMFSKNAPTN